MTELRVVQIGLPLRGRPILLITHMITDRIGLQSCSVLLLLHICLEILRDYKYCLGLKVEVTVELGHRVKSQCLYSSSDTLSQLPMNFHRN